MRSTTSMVLAKDFTSAETLSVLRDKFSPSLLVDNESLAPIVTVFNKLKNKLQEDSYRQAVGLLLQYNTSKTTEKLYDNILVENRLLHILREYDSLRFELLDVLHDWENTGGHILNAIQHNRIVKESINNEDVRKDDMQTDNHLPCSSSHTNDVAVHAKDDTKECPSLEFGLSRHLYQKIPTSLHHSNVGDSSATEEEMRDVAPSDEPKKEVLIAEHLDEPTETLGVNDRSDKSGTNTMKMVFAERGSSKRKALTRDVFGDEGAEEISIGETGVDELGPTGESVTMRRESEMGGRSRKRTRRLGAREDDMMLKKVGSHCIVIGVKEHAMTTDSSDYNTQSETETLGSEPITSQEDDEEGVLVIVEEKQSSSSKSKKQKRHRSRKSAVNLVKVSALCRGASMLEKCKTRNKTGNRMEEDGPQVVLKRGIRSARSQNNNINNNSCSASEFSDEDVLNTYPKVRPRSEDSSFSSLIRRKSDDERTVLDILSSAASQDYRSEKHASPVSNEKNKQLTRYHRMHSCPDRSTSIMPFTSYLGLQPCGLEGNILFPMQDNTNHLLKEDKRTSRSVYNSVKSRQGSLVARGNQSKSTRPKYDPNFPFSSTAFSAMSSIAEATTFEGSDYLHSQESSQDEILENSGWDTVSSQDSCCVERERMYGLGTFAQDDADDISFFNRLLRSPSPPSFGGNNDLLGKKKRHRHKPKRDRKPRKPRRSRRLRGKHSQEGDGDTNDTLQNNANKGGTGRACTCCL